jgi:Spy/CpxP family protein refolding chaperone
MKNSVLKTLFLLACISFSSIATSQPMGPPPAQKGKAELQGEKKENIEAMKIAFITNKLELSPEEAQKFWPVYNQYNEKLKDLRKKRRQDEREAKNLIFRKNTTRNSSRSLPSKKFQNYTLRKNNLKSFCWKNLGRKNTKKNNTAPTTSDETE